MGNLVAIVLGALVAYGPRAWLRQGRRLAVGAAAVICGLIPHFLYATKVAGWPLGLIFSATSQANRVYVGDGLVYYLAVFPYRLAGDLGGGVMAVGVFAFIALARRMARSRGTSIREHRPEDRRRLFLGSTAILLFVILGFATDGEPRFVFLSVVLLTILGVAAVAELTGRWATRPSPSPGSSQRIARACWLPATSPKSAGTRAVTPSPMLSTGACAHPTTPTSRSFSSSEAACSQAGRALRG